jgi:serine/threonine-protein kinase
MTDLSDDDVGDRDAVSLARVRGAIAGRYAVERLLGRGGMSDVYLAQDLKHRRKVAVKVLHEDLALVLGTERFLREIQIAARLQHPHILPMYDSGEQEGLVYYVMPFVGGESLDDLIRREQYLPVPVALRIAREVADGLGHAHDLGVVHRDIKPGNILLSGGHAVIADFGIARAVEAGSDLTRLTGTGQALGTPNYMSPEQAFGSKELDGRTDVYALGCVLYQMLAGQPPFTGPTAHAVMARHITDEAPPIRTVRSTVPEEVEAAIRKAMAKLPADRHATVREFAAAIAPSRADASADGASLGRAAVEQELDPKAIAVLPFKNLSNTPDAEPFAAGLHDDLVTELSRASALTVISRTSVEGYRGSKKTVHQIGRELGAGTIVEAGIQKAGERVRLNVQLIDARSNVHLWAERYDRRLSLENIFDLQSELSARIMEVLQAKLTGDEDAKGGAQPTTDLEAYRQYSIGRALFVDRSADALKRAVAAFERAVERDPDYALAWAGLGLALVNLVDYGHIDSGDFLVRGEAAARRAIEIDPELAEAYSALGSLHSARREGRKALAAHERAISLRPSFAGAHQWRCWVSLLIGDPRTAVEAGRRAERLDPLDPEAKGNLAFAHLGLGDDADALEVALGAVDQHPAFDYGRWVAGLALYRLGRSPEAREMLGGMSEAWSSGWPVTALGLERVESGDEDGARRVLARHVASGASFHAGLLHAALGETDAAFDEIRSVLPMKWDEALYVRYYEREPLTAMREDPRWLDLIHDLDRGWGGLEGG